MPALKFEDAVTLVAEGQDLSEVVAHLLGIEEQQVPGKTDAHGHSSFSEKRAAHAALMQRLGKSGSSSSSSTGSKTTDLQSLLKRPDKSKAFSLLNKKPN